MHPSTGHQLEHRVWSWLRDAAPEVGFIDLSKTSQGKTALPNDADFLVLKPFPAAIFVLAVANDAQAHKQSKRLLASRIALAEKYGPSLPAIVIVPDQSQKSLLRFADIVLSADNLPRLERVLREITLNSEVQKILKDGDPGDVEFSSQSRVESLWSKSVSLKDIVELESPSAPETLAEELARSLHQTRPRGRESSSASLRDEASDSCALADHSPVEESTRRPWFFSRQASTAFDSCLTAYIGNLFGAAIERRRARNSYTSGVIVRRLLWAPNGRVFSCTFLQTQAPLSFTKKPAEYVADAWMTRVVLAIPQLEQILLLGSIGAEIESMPRGGFDFRKNPPRLREINQLEAAGWKVFPWDFSQREPAFLKFMKGASYDQS